MLMPMFSPVVQDSIATMAVVSTSLDDSSAQDFTTTALGGLTPDGAIILASANCNVDAGMDGIESCVLFADDSTLVGSGFTSRDARGTTDTKRGLYTDGTFTMEDDTGATEWVISSHSFITNGIRLNFSNVPDNATRAITVLLFCNSGAKVGDYAMATSLNGTTDIDCGFDPKTVITSHGSAPSANIENTWDGYNNFVIGFMDTGADQGSLYWSDRDGKNTSFIEMHMDTGCLVKRAGWELEGSYITDGFRLTTRDSTANAEIGLYIAFENVQSDLVSQDMAGSTSATVNSGLTVAPQGLITVFAKEESFDINYDDTQSAELVGMGIAASLNSNAQGGFGWFSENSQGSSDCTMYHHGSACALESEEGVGVAAAGVVSNFRLDTTGKVDIAYTHDPNGRNELAHWLLLAAA